MALLMYGQSILDGLIFICESLSLLVKDGLSNAHQPRPGIAIVGENAMAVAAWKRD